MDHCGWNPQIPGFANGMEAKAEGFRTIMLAVMVDEQMTFVLVEVLYVPSAECNLFLPGLALDQGIKLPWDLNTRMFGMTKDNIEVIHTTYETSPMNVYCSQYWVQYLKEHQDNYKTASICKFCNYKRCRGHRRVA
ncbi:unnamed protein product [Peronospora belbahrii]|uniref:Uncharacterized protein n=1 Tax=Peronospora belbahrii TaxID=622444 RepID=A0AAU9LBG5_9STRA|nr:unnamed protein product [Peronospora belbahrii]